MKNYKLILSVLKKQKCTPANFFQVHIALKIALFCFLFAAAITVGTSTIVSALERPTAEEIEQYKRDGTLAKRIENAKSIGNHRASPSFVKRSHYKLNKLFKQIDGYTLSELPEIFAPPPAWEGMPTTGNVKILALLIDFPDYPHSNTATSINSKLYGSGSGEYPYESLHNFYDRSSYSQLNIQGSTLGWYRTAYNRSSIVENTTGRENLIKEVLNYYNSSGHDFTQYDNDGDGAIDYFVVIWSGPSGAWASFWWGYMTTFSDSSYTIDGKRLDTYSWQWEASPYPGTYTPLVVIHETGHALGLPDLYDYDGNIGPDGGVGNLDMMDANWGDHNCFSKFVLDWITPTTISSGSNTVTLYASGSSEDAVVIMPGISSGDQFEEFFMVQNRYRTNNDTNYPNDGLLIWHIDSRLDYSGYNFLYNNSYTDHKLVRLMEADGLEQIEMNDWASADAGDYYTMGDAFGPSTFPDSDRYDGTSTGITVENISASGTVMTAHMSIAGFTGGLIYNSVPPCRIIDTRISQGGSGPIIGETQRNFIASGLCGVPHGPAKAVMINIAATKATGPGNLRAFAYPEPVPFAAVLNYGSVFGLNAISNAAIIPICNYGIQSCSFDLSIWVSRTTDVVVDVMGYFSSP